MSSRPAGKASWPGAAAGMPSVMQSPGIGCGVGAPAESSTSPSLPTSQATEDVAFQPSPVSAT